MKNKILIVGYFLFATATFFAQRKNVDYLPTFDKRKVHYGFYLGLNQNDFKFSLRDNPNVPNASISVEPQAGFNVGLIADLRLHKNLNLRLEPGLMTNSKRLIFNNDLITRPQDSARDVSSTYFHVPLLLKFSTDRYRNIRPYILGGISYDYNLSSNQDNQDDNSAGQFRMQTHNFMYEVGIGIDIYLYFFKFSPSIRGVFAINNEVVYDDDPNSRWTAPINFMGTRGVFLSFAFE
ncbi:PorT family protein [Polaribacter sp. WD7]|uniref:type IX secretion/gliding motility protein PorT/SprT n=1 Tax=Polaribacter sp. WD7 TaxID=2269061 RepID=UPI000DF4B9BD|nr:porin family protein [Polaribacter sp. WD7]RCS27908.1 PorT family protein [Polaribacter sp. WD7]